MGNEIFDREKTLQRVDNDWDLLRELVGLFVSEFENHKVELVAAVKSGNAPLLKRAAHTVKGASGNIGAAKVHSLAASLEKIGGSGQLQDAASTLDKLLQAVNEFIDHFARQASGI